MRSLAVIMACALVAWIGAAASVLYSAQRSADERRALVSFVCAAIEVAKEQSTPEPLRRAERFREILDSIGERCPE
jgi:hypothetical protein